MFPVPVYARSFGPAQHLCTLLSNTTFASWCDMCLDCSSMRARGRCSTASVRSVALTDRTAPVVAASRPFRLHPISRLLLLHRCPVALNRPAGFCPFGGLGRARASTAADAFMVRVQGNGCLLLVFHQSSPCCLRKTLSCHGIWARKRTYGGACHKAVLEEGPVFVAAPERRQGSSDREPAHPSAARSSLPFSFPRGPRVAPWSTKGESLGSATSPPVYRGRWMMCVEPAALAGSSMRVEDSVEFRFFGTGTDPVVPVTCLRLCVLCSSLALLLPGVGSACPIVCDVAVDLRRRVRVMCRDSKDGLGSTLLAFLCRWPCVRRGVMSRLARMDRWNRPSLRACPPHVAPVSRPDPTATSCASSPSHDRCPGRFCVQACIAR